MEADEADEEEVTVFSPAARREYLATKYPGIVMPKCPWDSSEEEKEEEKEEKEETPGYNRQKRRILVRTKTPNTKKSA